MGHSLDPLLDEVKARYSEAIDDACTENFEVDCAVHGAVRALRDALLEIASLRSQVRNLEIDLRTARKMRDLMISNHEEMSFHIGRLENHVVEVPRNHMDRLRGWLEHPNGALVLNRVTLESVEHGGILIRTRPYAAPTHLMPGMWETADLIGGQTDYEEGNRGTAETGRDPGSSTTDDA